MNKYTASARGQVCQVRIPGVCNDNSETVVFAHLNGAGVGRKHSPIHGCYACSDCHAFLDYGYAQALVDRETRDLLHLEAVIRTQIIMIEAGILVL